jgi:2-polyprenyl-3-methyl-5-hydroxy-6-metoxy-1,4-benzoquinol methylase
MPATKQPLTTEEDLFCTRYELETLSGIINHNSLERWVPGFCSPHTHREHVLRYEWVKEFVKDKRVLDIACGAGFGSYQLAKEGNAARVTGYDIDEKTITYAAIKNKHPKLDFRVNDAETFGSNSEYDIIVSFETIEHLKRPLEFLKNINRALVPGGVFFVSTPISSLPENNNPDNKYHITEWGFTRFRNLVSQYLTVEEVYLQLYSVLPKPKTGLLSRIAQKAGWAKDISLPGVEKLEPHKWVPRELKEELIGKEWEGYQLLQCQKK